VVADGMVGEEDAPLPVEFRVVAAAGNEPYATFFLTSTFVVSGRSAATRLDICA
jgi:hypothetical protein